MRHRLYNGDCLEILKRLPHYDCLFADPPDNIRLGYSEYADSLPDAEYARLLKDWLYLFLLKAGVVWVSFNAKWTFEMGRIVCNMRRDYPKLEAKPCVQTYTFGQHNHFDLGNNHRPLWRFRADPDKTAAIPGPDSRAVMASRAWRQAGRSPWASARRRVRLHSRHGQLEAAPYLAPDATQRGLGGTVHPHVYVGPERGR